MARLSVFFSYSLTKTYDAELTKQVIEIAKQRVSARAAKDWKIVDPLAPALGWIRNKVEGALRDVDALVAEATTWAPNVIYEMGFARSNKYPLIILINRNPPKDERLSAYYDFLGIDEGQPLPADLGDIEFIEYDNYVVLPGALEGFKQKIDMALDTLEGLLPPGMRSLRREERRLQEKTDQLGRVMQESLVDDPPLLRLVGGWLERVVKELGEAGSQGFLVSPKYYSACFAKFNNLERNTAYAIADFSRRTEVSSVLTSADVDMSVNERIVLISGRQLFDDESLLIVFKEIRSHLERTSYAQYRILIARSDASASLPDHPFANPISQDLLLISPNLVGGYEAVDEQSYLRVVASKEVFEKGVEYYERVKALAFPFDPEWKESAEIRSAWLTKERQVGRWNSEWKFEHRDAIYYDLYDFNIRFWVPGYEDFILHTAARVVDAMLRPSNAERQDRPPVKILEIGAGTGGLTTRLLNAIQRSSAAKESFDRLIALDMAQEMVEATKRSVARTLLGDRVSVVRGTAFSGLPSEIGEHRSFGVICGSLVLSHLLQAKVQERLEPLLKDAKSHLAPGGSLVFADALVPEPHKRKKVKEQWRKSMIKNGLLQDRTEHFLNHNQEMLKTVTFEELETASRRHGFTLKVEDIPGFVGSPFRTITLTLKEVASPPSIAV